MIADLTVISGPMFAGKTTALIERISVASQTCPVVIIKPAMDRRYGDHAIVTHDGLTRPAIGISGEAELFQLVANAQERAGRTVHVFADEVQFLDHPHFVGAFHMAIHSLLQAGHCVTCGGLDLDWRGLPFDVTARLLAMADTVEKLTARCHVTGLPAAKTYKRIADASRIALGAADTYEARSNAAWEGVERTDQMITKRGRKAAAR
jgi:thymidine kinase